jgi:hypothetical protein
MEDVRDRTHNGNSIHRNLTELQEERVSASYLPAGQASELVFWQGWV